MATCKNYYSLLCTEGGRLAILTADGSVDGIGGVGYKKFNPVKSDVPVMKKPVTWFTLQINRMNGNIDLEYEKHDCVIQPSGSHKGFLLDKKF